MAARKAGRGEKSKAGQLLILLVVLGGLCAWNYQRNLAAENASPSAYAGVSDADLEVLIAAYQGEIDAMRGKGPGRAKARATSGVANGVREFERVQRTSRSVREAGYALSEREGAVRALEKEKARRAALSGGAAQVFLRRAFSF